MERWLVFIEDGTRWGRASYCVQEGSDAVRLLTDEGYKLVCDNAATRFEGWTYAAIHHGCLPDDYEDRMMPGIIWDPLPLYRSVSIPELEGIVACGEIHGGQNTFNPGERRKFVFFAKEPTPQTIGQGEDATRLAEYLAYQSCLADDVDLSKGNEELKRRYLDILQDEKAMRQAADFSSVILKTIPIAVGMHYSRENGSTGMNGEDEFGLFPGQVKLADIVEVYWVKDGIVRAVTSVAEISEKLEMLKSQRAMALEPEEEVSVGFRF